MPYVEAHKHHATALYAAALAALVGLSGCGKTAPAPDETARPAQASAGGEQTAVDAHELHDSTAEPADQGAHEDHAAHEPAAAPALAPGERWPTDAPLRTAMTRIEAAVEARAAAYADGSLAQSEAAELAAEVQENVHYMIANCRLAPEPDAALHVLIGRMMSASTAMKADPAAESGFPQLVSVLRDYKATFDHAQAA